MKPLRAGARRTERGQTTAEYLGVLVVVAAVIAALVLSGIGPAIADGVSRALCRIMATTCPARATETGPLTIDLAKLRKASPAEARRMLADLSSAEQRRLVALVPEVIGALDGAPAQMR